MIFMYKFGGGEKYLELEYPLFKLGPKLGDFRKIPFYCTKMKPQFNSTLPDFDESLKKLFIDDFNLFRESPMRTKNPVNNLYSNVYSSLDFAKKHKKIVLIDSFYGITANILNDMYGVEIHYFSPKISVKPRAGVFIYNRLPGKKDCEKLRGTPLISLPHFLFREHNINNMNNSSIYIANYHRKLLNDLRPSRYLICQTGAAFNYEIKVPAGKILAMPFSVINPWGSVAIEGNDYKNYQVINLYDLLNRKILFDYCIRPLVHGYKINDNWDCWYAHRFDIKKIIDVLGPLPSSENEAIEPVKPELFNNFIKPDLTFTYVTAFIENHKIINTRDVDLILEKKNRVVIVNEKQRTMMRILDIPKKKNMAFFTNWADNDVIDFMRAFGAVFIRGKLPEFFARQNNPSYKYYEVKSLEEAREIAKKEKYDFHDNLNMEYFSKPLAERLKKHTKMIAVPNRIWVNTNAYTELIITVLHEIWPNAVINVLGPSKNRDYVVNYKPIENFIDIYGEDQDVYWDIF